MPRILYPIKAEPVLTPEQRPEQVTESRWHQPLSEPRRWRGLIAAVVATTTFAVPSFVPNPVPVPFVPSWAGQISQPTLRVSAHALQQSHFNPSWVPTVVPPPLVSSWSGQLSISQPTLRLSSHGLQQSHFNPSWVPDPVAPPSVSGWAGQISQPILPPRRTADFPALVWSDFTPAERDLRWFQPLSEPTRRKATVHPDSTAFTYLVVAGVSGDDSVRFSSTNTVVPYSRTVLYQSIVDVYTPVSAETVTVDKWFAALSEPIRVKRPAAEYPALVWSAFTPAETDLRWFRPLDEPTRRKVPVPQQDEQAWSGFTPAETDLRWYTYLTEPTRRTSAHALQQSFFFVGSDPARDTQWRQPLSQPTRETRRAVEFPAFSWGYVTPPSAEDVTVDKWFPPLSQPTRRTVSVAELPSTFRDAFPITVATYEWRQPLEQPVRETRRAAEYPALNWSYFTPEPPAEVSRGVGKPRRYIHADRDIDKRRTFSRKYWEELRAAERAQKAAEKRAQEIEVEAQRREALDALDASAAAIAAAAADDAAAVELRRLTSALKAAAAASKIAGVLREAQHAEVIAAALEAHLEEEDEEEAIMLLMQS